jgi:hypothetical protein
MERPDLQSAKFPDLARYIDNLPMTYRQNLRDIARASEAPCLETMMPNGKAFRDCTAKDLREMASDMRIIEAVYGALEAKG